METKEYKDYEKADSIWEKMILDKLNQMFNQPDYKTILEDVLNMLKNDMKTIHNSYTEHYVQNVIDEIEDSLK